MKTASDKVRHTCTLCGEKIKQSAPIVFRPGVGAFHHDCWARCSQCRRCGKFAPLVVGDLCVDCDHLEGERVR